MQATQQTLWGQAITPKADFNIPDKRMVDPRPDLKFDSHSWTKFLRSTEEKNPTLAKILHGFRCGGLRLYKDNFGHMLRPVLDPKLSIWKSQQEYERDKNKWLMPYQQEIIDLLKMHDYLDGFEEVESIG